MSFQEKEVNTINNLDGHNQEPQEDERPIPSKGYNMSFLEKLDDPNFDPFKTKATVKNDLEIVDKRMTNNEPTTEDSRKLEAVIPTTHKPKLTRSGTFTKSDVKDTIGTTNMEESNQGSKFKKERPKKTIFSKLIKSQRKLVRSNTMSVIDSDNNMSDSEPPRPPSLHIDLLLQSINRSKVSEASNVSDFMDVVESDQDSPPIRQISSEDPNYKPQCQSLGSINDLSTSNNQNFQNLSENKSDTFPEPTIEGQNLHSPKLTHSNGDEHNLHLVVSKRKSNWEYSVSTETQSTDLLDSMVSNEVGNDVGSGMLSSLDNFDILKNHTDDIRNESITHKKDQVSDVHVQDLKKEISRYKEELVYLDQNEDVMENVINQFQTTISEIMASREKQRTFADIQKEKIVSQKAQIVGDLIAAENAYTDVKGKYERTKQLITKYKIEEEKLKQGLADRKSTLEAKQTRFDTLRCHAEDKIRQANEVILQIKGDREAEIAKLATMLRKSEIRVESLEQIARQKSDESRELADMCDELIASTQKSCPRLRMTM